MATPRRNTPIHRYHLKQRVIYRGQLVIVCARPVSVARYDLLLPNGKVEANVAEDEIVGTA